MEADIAGKPKRAGLAETQRLCEAAGLPQGLRVTTHIADVSERTQVERFRNEVADRHQIDKIHLLFNNAGISGGGSMVTNSRDEWERTFNICWGGVSRQRCGRPLGMVSVAAYRGTVADMV
jgi:NAD(P)-dependent dehydrogenase (short-subunit alcohol dehydrogenase family)